MADGVKSNEGETIKPGDYVEGKIRGGSHRGNVCFHFHHENIEVSACAKLKILWLLLVDEIVTTKEEAEERDVKNPPKVS